MRHSAQHPIQRPMRNSSGFSLIELLIVVAIILIIAAIALPNFLRSRITANETATVANLRNITTANVVYSTTYNIGYAAQLSYLGGTGALGPTSAQLIDDVLAAGTKSGYALTYTPGPLNAVGMIDSYVINANPVAPGGTGTRYFFMDESGTIRFNVNTPATVADSPIS